MSESSNGVYSVINLKCKKRLHYEEKGENITKERKTSNIQKAVDFRQESITKDRNGKKVSIKIIKILKMIYMYIALYTKNILNLINIF